jgi:crotonobetainyl-CoA:carnitine CoA-transferase CaiB-like acyl-CoA transferase
VTAQPSSDACLRQLEAARVPSAAVQRIDQVVADPQVQARGMLFEQDHPVLGRVRLPNVPYRFSDVDLTPRRPAPLLGEHNREILRDLLGYPEAEIRRLEDEGVLHREHAAKDSS